MKEWNDNKENITVSEYILITVIFDKYLDPY